MTKLYVAIMVEENIRDRFVEKREKKNITSSEYLEQLMDNENE